MSEMTVQVGGGFRGDGYPPWMSDGLVMRLELAEQEERKVDQAFARTVRAVEGDPHTRALQLSGELARQRGEYYTHREVMHGAAGRTRAEVLAYASAQMDLEDAQLRARQRREAGITGTGVEAEQELSRRYSADVSAPHPDEVATRGRLARWRSARFAEDAQDRRIVQLATAAVSVAPEVVAATRTRWGRRR